MTNENYGDYKDKPKGNCFPNNFSCNEVQDIETSLESILESEASISDCASKLFSSIFPCELDSIDDIQKKINLFTTLLLAYNNRPCSLGKLIKSINETCDEYIPQPHIDIFDSCIDQKGGNCCAPPRCYQPKKPTPSCHYTQPNPCNCNTSPNCTCTYKTYDCPTLCSCNYKPPCPPKNACKPCTPSKPTCYKPQFAQYISCGIYFLEKINIYSSSSNTQITYNLYYNNKTKKIFALQAAPCSTSKSFIIN